MFSLTNHFKREKLITRKEHECFRCHNTIAPKTDAVKISTRYDKKLYPFYLHFECERVVQQEELQRGITPTV